MQKGASQTGFCTRDKESKVSSKLKMLEVPWTALKQHLTASDCTVTPMAGISGKWWSPAGACPTCSEVLGDTCGGGCYCCAAARKGQKFPHHWLAQRFRAFCSARFTAFSSQHHFPSPKSQARNVCKLQCLDLLQKENIFTMKEQGNVLVPAIWMSLLEAKRRNVMHYRGQACLNEADPTATQDNSRLSLTSKEAESYP